MYRLVIKSNQIIIKCKSNHHINFLNEAPFDKPDYLLKRRIFVTTSKIIKKIFIRIFHACLHINFSLQCTENDENCNKNCFFNRQMQQVSVVKQILCSSHGFYRLDRVHCR